MVDVDNADNILMLEALLQVSFHDRAILLRAITHHSCCTETAARDSYDTLEFLGDAIISAHVVEYIYRNFPTATEGEMTALKSEVVSRRILARVGQELGLFPFIRVDIANLRTFNERSRDSLCADVLEALVGAIHIDQGPDSARTFVTRTILPMVAFVQQHTIDTNPKGRLQKIILHRSGHLPVYRILKEGGHYNDRSFEVGVFEGNTLLGVGKASSIKEAGRIAASEALIHLHQKEEGDKPLPYNP
jgi:ribonuclease-3